MKKLSLLKPDRRQVYLNFGKGQEVDYLNISKELNLESLEKDVKNGAVHFKELLSIAKKKPSRVVVVDCTNEEQGLMAVSYLAAVYNEVDNASADCEEMPTNCTTEKKSFDVEDFEALINDEEPEYEDEQWDENPYRVPIIMADELKKYNTDGFAEIPFADSNRFVNGLGINPVIKPYWVSLRNEPVCIIDSCYYTNRNFGMCFERTDISNEIKRFAGNRHVFVLNVHQEYEEREVEEGPNMNAVYIFDPYLEYKQKLYKLILEHTASLVAIKGTESEMAVYHKHLFENWAPALGVALAKGFPKENILKQIMQIRGEDKSALIEKVYKYVLSQDGVDSVLTKDDFEVISKFRTIGIGKEDRDGKHYIRKMEQTLIGLEEVKEQVYGIIDVMKYNKKRAKLGYGTGGYHNVHLMIGAPGTAKTTIAQMMGNIMMEQKLLPSNRFISINGAELKGMYVGHSAPKTKAYFDNYDIILIDEAYSLTSDKEMDSFSQEAIAQLIIELENHGMDKLVIFAGYGGINVDEKDNKMLQFLEANPGIRSRINSTIYFKSYSPDEMVDIVHCMAKNNKFNLTNEADCLIKEHFERRCKKTDFGNGREARSLLENITLEAAKRVMRLEDGKLTKKVLKELLLSDVEAALLRKEKSYNMQNGRNTNINYGFATKE